MLTLSLAHSHTWINFHVLVQRTRDAGLYGKERDVAWWSTLAAFSTPQTVFCGIFIYSNQSVAQRWSSRFCLYLFLSLSFFLFRYRPFISCLGVIGFCLVGFVGITHRPRFRTVEYIEKWSSGVHSYCKWFLVLIVSSCRELVFRRAQTLRNTLARECGGWGHQYT